MTTPLRVLILEDRLTDAELVLRELRRAGFEPLYERVDTEAEFLAHLNPTLDVILADYSMPQFSAPRALELIQQHGVDVPFIIVSGTVGEDAAVAAIKQGAADYLLKDRLRRLGPAVSQAIEQHRLRQVQRRLTRLETDIGTALISHDQIGTTLNQCSDALVRNLHIPGARIWTLAPDGQNLELAAQTGLEHELPGLPNRCPIGHGLLGSIAVARQPRLIHPAGDAAAAPDEDWASPDGLVSLAVYPLVIERQLVGAMALFSRELIADLVFITAQSVANQIALAIQHRYAREALAESDLRFRQIAENIEEVFWLSNPTTTQIFYVSPAYERIWGRSCQSLYANPQEFIDAVHPEDRPRLAATLKQKLTNGHFEHDYRILRPDGSERWIRDHGFPIRDANGEIYRIAGIAQDITERKELERQLIQAQKMEAMGQLAGGVAHDFNNLLLVITLASDQLLTSRPETDPDRSYAEEILKACHRAAQLTRQLLAFSRKQVMDLRVIDVNEVVAGTEKMLRRLIGANITLVSELGANLGRVRADTGAIEQVIVNMAVNARDAMPNGGHLTLCTENVVHEAAQPLTSADLPAGAYTLLSIRDTGTGMSPDVQARIFEPFFTTKTDGRGTGLGLATCFGIVRQSGGYIDVQSAPGQGSTFRIFLPRVGGTQHATPARTIAPDKRPQGHETILLVEDEETVRTLAVRALREKGYHVIEAGNGAEGLQLARHHQAPIHLIITDIVMPHLGGKSMSDQIRAFSPETRVLYCSGYMDSTISEDGLISADTAFLQKPFSFGDLIRKVREVLDR